MTLLNMTLEDESFQTKDLVKDTGNLLDNQSTGITFCQMEFGENHFERFKRQQSLVYSPCQIGHSNV